jgi:response regulator of citrate/malate metabolism
MFLNLDDLTMDQLIEKQIELRQRKMQALSMGMDAGVLGQLQNMLDQVEIQITTKTAGDALESARNEKDSDIDGVSLDIA